MRALLLALLLLAAPAWGSPLEAAYPAEGGAGDAGISNPLTASLGTGHFDITSPTAASGSDIYTSIFLSPVRTPPADSSAHVLEASNQFLSTGLEGGPNRTLQVRHVNAGSESSNAFNAAQFQSIFTGTAIYCVCDGNGTDPYGTAALIEDADPCPGGGALICPDGADTGVDDGVCVAGDGTVNTTGCDGVGQNFYHGAVAVDISNERIDHPLGDVFTSGDGPFRWVRVSGNSIASGWTFTDKVSDQDIYLCRIDADTVEVYDSSSNASTCNGSTGIYNLTTVSPGWLIAQSDCTGDDVCIQMQSQFPVPTDRIDAFELLAKTDQPDQVDNELLWGIDSDGGEKCHPVHAPASGTCQYNAAPIKSDSVAPMAVTLKTDGTIPRPSPLRGGSPDSDGAVMSAPTNLDLRLNLAGANQTINNLKFQEIKIHSSGGYKANNLDLTGSTTGITIADLSHPELSAAVVGYSIGAQLSKPSRQHISVDVKGGGFDTGRVDIGEWTMISRDNGSVPDGHKQLAIRRGAPFSNVSAHPLATGADGSICSHSGGSCTHGLIAWSTSGLSCTDACVYAGGGNDTTNDDEGLTCDETQTDALNDNLIGAGTYTCAGITSPDDTTRMCACY